jgi:methionyl-tRNA synthetase
MIRYTCDKCGREMSDREPRYEAKVEAGPVYDETADLFEDIEYGEESLTEMMERLDREAWQDNSGGSFRFDLCESCYQEFVGSPLFKGMRARSGFRR